MKLVININKLKEYHICVTDFCQGMKIRILAVTGITCPDFAVLFIRAFRIICFDHFVQGFFFEQDRSPIRLWRRGVAKKSRVGFTAGAKPTSLVEMI